MKKSISTLLLLSSFLIHGQIISFADANFKNSLVNSTSVSSPAKGFDDNYLKVDANSDGEIQISEALLVKSLSYSFGCFRFGCDGLRIGNFQGLTSFSNLEIFSATGQDAALLDVKNLSRLKTLKYSLHSGVYGAIINNYIKFIGATNLEVLDISASYMDFDLSTLLNLKELRIASPNLTALDLRPNTKLEILYCGGNSSLTSVNWTGLTNLKEIDCSSNSKINSLSFDGLINLKKLVCNLNPITELNVSSCTNLEYLSCQNSKLTSLDVTGLSKLTYLNIYDNLLTTINTSTLSSLKEFTCGYNKLSTLDLAGLSKLTLLICRGNLLSSLDLTGLSVLEEMDCNSNQITSLNLSPLTSVKDIDVSFNKLSAIDVNGLTNLINLDCRYNLISSSLDLTGLNNLQSLDCNTNQIPAIVFGGNAKLTSIECSNNLITTLDLSNFTLDSNLSCYNNLLESLYLKNGKKEVINIYGNPTLKFICQDQDAIYRLQQDVVNPLNYTNCVVSPFCSFTPGGIYYTVQGGQKFDFNNNGCDNADSNLPYLKYTISDGTTSDYVISKEDGDYLVNIPAGYFSLSPTFENPSYYTSNPATLNVSFPTQSSPFTQDFCITANGAHPDLEVVIIPIQQARPGFDATYKIIVKNKGTITQSGTLNLAFDDTVLDFVSSNPTLGNQSLNSLSWGFSNLIPFETKTINLVLNLNSPLETPALNMGDILHFSATVTSAETDETPLDNTFDFNQTVVNSFDPNDITCLEGETVPLTDKDFYLHYIVRFENTGNFAAQNIVVEDVIDTNVYDVASLVPMSSSHPFYTIKKSGYGIQTAVHFIFENINLPFTNGLNTGYIAFKIKTKHPYYDFSKSIWNKKANIYFDYNYPIKTNMVSTSMKTLSSEDFTSAKKIAFYPNPANDKIYFSQKQKSVTVFTIEGKKINSTLKNKEIDISELPKGIYLLQIQTIENTVITQKLIKN
jgi:Leucine-rich repeat (LRR) protein